MSQNNRNYGGYNRGQQSRNRRNAGRGEAGRERGEYIYGNAVRKAEPERRWEEEPEKKSAPARRLEQAPARRPHPEVRKNREKAKHMNAGYVLFLGAAVCICAFILVNYIQLHAELTAQTRRVASKESELNQLKLSNDEEYNRIVNSIDLEEIKRIAMGELGMIYAQEGQIVTYENEGRDYMRKVTDGNQ